jgi:hypothetical protein
MGSATVSELAAIPLRIRRVGRERFAHIRYGRYDSTLSAVAGKSRIRAPVA